MESSENVHLTADWDLPVRSGSMLMREEEFFDMLCNTGDGVFIVDGNKRIVRWNSEAEKILKVPEAEAMNQECFRVVSGRTAPEKPLCCPNCRMHANVLRGTPQKNFDMLSQTNEGEPLWLNVTLISPSGSDEPFVAHIIRDITREKKARVALDRFLADLENHNWMSWDDPHGKTSPRDSSGMPESPTTALSGREIEVLKLLAEGLSTKGLAQRLSISHFTARNHIQNILVKLDLHSKAQAVSYAFKKGIL